MSFSVNYDFRIFDRFTAPLKKMNRALSKHKNKINSAANAAKKYGSKMANLNNAIGGAAAVYSFGKAFKSFTNLEDALFDVQRVTDMTSGSLNAFRSDIEKMSEELGRPAVALAQIAFEGGKLGVAEKDLMGFTNQVVKMAVAFDMTEQSAGQAIGSIQAKMGLTLASVTELADSVNFLADNTASNGARMIEILARVSGTFKTLRIPPQASASLAGFADQLEVTPELAASGLNMAFRKMMKMPGMMTKLLKDPMKAFQSELSRFNKMPEAKRAGELFKEYGDEAGRFMLKAVGNVELLDKTMSAAFSSGAIGSMDREMANRAGRTSTKWSRAMESMNNAFSAFGEAIAPAILAIADVITPIAKGFRDFSKNHPGISAIAGSIAVVAVGMLALLVPLGFIISGMGSLITALPIVAAGFKVVAAAMAANPIGLIITAVAALVTWFGYLYSRTGSVTDSLKIMGQSILNFLLSPIRATIEGLGMLAKAVGLEGVGEALDKYGDSFRVGFADDINLKSASDAKSGQSVNVNSETTVNLNAGNTNAVGATSPDLNTGVNVAFAN